jgi:ABC-2 type transport system ATP-binding protein
MSAISAAGRAGGATPAGGLAMDLAEVAKTYRGKVRALRGITMQVRRGEVFGLLGPNGAGKSTLVKILMTVIRPTRCRGTVLERAVGHKPTLARVGYLPEHHRFAEYLTGEQVIQFYGAMANTPRRERRRRGAELLEIVGMKDWGRKRVRSYSKGMRQRIGIAQALVNDPELVLLDEPTDGVDPVGRRDIRNICLRMKEEGRTVFINSHLLSELEMVCDRVAILVKGVVTHQGTLDELTRDKQHYVVEVAAMEGGPVEDARRLLPGSVLRGELAETALASTAAEPAVGGAGGAIRRVAWKGTLASGESLEIERNVMRIGTIDPQPVQAVIDALRERGAVIRAVRPYRPSLEDLFMEAVTDPRTGETLTPGAEKNAARSKGRKGARR